MAFVGFKDGEDVRCTLANVRSYDIDIPPSLGFLNVTDESLGDGRFK